MAVVNSITVMFLLCVWVAVIIVAAARWSQIRSRVTDAWMYAVAVLGLSIPQVLWTLAESDELLADNLPALEVTAGVRIAVSAGVLFVWCVVAASTSLFAAIAVRWAGTSSILPAIESRRSTFLGKACLIGVLLGAWVVLAIAVDLFSVSGDAASGPLFDRVVKLSSILRYAVIEEILFRGVVYTWIVRHSNSVGLAIGVSTALFVGGHAVGPLPIVVHLPLYTILGLVLVQVRRKYDLDAAIACHVAYNLVVSLQFFVSL